MDVTFPTNVEACTLGGLVAGRGGITKHKVESLWKSLSQPSGIKAGSVGLCDEQFPWVTAWFKHSSDQGHPESLH